MKDALAYFHELRIVFVETGVRPDGFALPRQHALVHYVDCIHLFGSPNGLCSSITESKHIVAVKEPWRRSNRNEPLEQIIKTNARLSKLGAARVVFGQSGLLQGDVLTAALQHIGADVEDSQQAKDATYLALRDSMDADGPRCSPSVWLGHRAGEYAVYGRFISDVCSLDSVCPVHDMAVKVGEPELHTLISRFLHEETYPDVPLDVHVPLDEYPYVSARTRVSRYLSCSATFYAPSELSGPYGMHREIIRCNPSWFGKFARFDTILVHVDPHALGVRSMRVARVRAFISFTYDDVLYSCALVEWFTFDDIVPDPITGMWVISPTVVDNVRATGIVNVTSIIRACHLMPVFGATYIPVDFTFSDTLDAFNTYYLNSYVDYHSHETLL